MKNFITYIIGIPLALITIYLILGGWNGYVFGKRVNIIVPMVIIIMGNIFYDFYIKKYKKKNDKNFNNNTNEQILGKHVEESKYISDYYKSSFFDRIKLLKQKESFDEIIKMCDLYLKNNNPHVSVKEELWNEMGFSYKMIGENYKAIDMFKKTLETNNRHLDATEGLAQTYLKLKDYNSAIEWLQKSEENFKREINDLKISGIPNSKFNQLTEELNKIQTMLEALKSGYRPE